MNILQPYVGQYVTATSANTKIDIDTILAGCDAVDNEASQISTVGSEVRSNGSSITESALSFDGMTVQNMVSECCAGIDSVQEMILSATANIREAAVNVYNQFQEQFNEEARVRDNEMIRNNQK